MFSSMLYILTHCNFYLKMFLATILFLMCNYTGTIDINVRNVFKMCSDLFWIRCKPFLFFMTTINMSQFMACISFISYLYMSTISFALLIEVSCAAYACSYIYWQIFVPIHTYKHNHHMFFLILRCSQSHFLALLIIRTQRFFVFILFLVARNFYVDAFQVFPIH